MCADVFASRALLWFGRDHICEAVQQSDLQRSVVGLPDKLFLYASVPVSVILLELAVRGLGVMDFAHVTDTGQVIINERVFRGTFDAGVTVGRHEGGYLIEVYLSGGDTGRFESAQDAKRIMNRAFREHKKDNPDAPARLERAIFEYSSAPSLAWARTGNNALLYSEGLAEAIERFGDEVVESNLFLAFVRKSVEMEMRM